MKLLERRYCVPDGPSNGATRQPFTTLLTALPNVSSSGRSSPSLPTLLRWSLRDKKRVETILESFKDRNSRLRRKVELWCFASQLGISPDHLRHLQTDESSRRLGFDKDAAICLAQQCTEGGGGDHTPLELPSSWDPYLKEIAAEENQGLFTVLVKDSHVYVQENHRHDAPVLANSSGMRVSRLDARTKGRIESLARLLHQPKEQIFRILPCVGWRELPDKDYIAFVFELPSPLGSPASLQRILFESKLVPSLGDKFQLALGLCQCMAQIHMVQWVRIAVTDR